MREPRLTLLRAVDRKPSPWKNGGGMTTEIAVSPEGASLESFDWRVSIATLESDGAFSLFPGVDRVCAILAGAVSLRVGDAKPIALETMSPPFGFPGDALASAQVLRGPVEDLNVFARRGYARASIERIQWIGRLARRTNCDTCVVVARANGMSVACGVEILEALQVDDAVRIDAARDTNFILAAREMSTAYLIRLNEPQSWRRLWWRCRVLFDQSSLGPGRALLTVGGPANQVADLSVSIDWLALIR